MLPGGQHVLFTLATGTAPIDGTSAQIVVQSLKSRRTEDRSIDGGSDARYVPTGHLVYAVSGSAVRGRVRPAAAGGDGRARCRSSKASGELPAASTGAANFSVSSTGSLVYVPARSRHRSALLDIALMDRNGKRRATEASAGPYALPRVSPDGTRIAFGTDDGKEAIVWIYDLSGTSAMQRLTSGGNNRFPIWSADSKRVAFQSDRDGDLAIFWQPADGTGTPNG